ncbi:MAG: hypothetical protein HKM28_05090 [Flavobacteriaceae bacterium]|nr:hypothetical protein [Flavobacteriaceae bacterium]
MKIVIQIVLWILIVFLGYQLYNSVSGPLRFNEIKEERYRKVIRNLKDIKAAELAHKEITGKFTGDFDSLVRFIDTAQFAITVRRDTSYADVEKNKAFGLDPQTGGYIKEAIIVDTLGFTPVRDSLYGSTGRYKTMMNVPVEGSDAKFDLQAGTLEKNDITYAVFEAKVSKDVILGDQDKDLLMQEKQVVSVEGVNGTHIIVGSMTDVNTSGNWPKLYDSAKEQ